MKKLFPKLLPKKWILFFSTSFIFQFIILISVWFDQYHPQLRLFTLTFFLKFHKLIEEFSFLKTIPLYSFANAGMDFPIYLAWYFPGTLILIFSYLRPRWSIYFILVIMVCFGSDPPNIKLTRPLIFMTAMVCIGIYTKLLFRQKYQLKRFIVKLEQPNPVIFLIGIFLIASVLSLTSLTMWKMILSENMNTPTDFFSKVLVSNLHSPFFSIASVLYIWQAMLIGLYLYGTTTARNQISFIKKTLGFLIFGWSIFVIFGFLDYLKIFEIYPFRGKVDPRKLLSFFGNSTWTSEYLAITTPLIPVILLLYKKTWTLLSLLLLSVMFILGEIAIFLTFQRGGWLTSIFSFFVVIISILYTWVKQEKYSQYNISITPIRFLKKSWEKILIIIPIFILIISLSVFLLFQYQQKNKLVDKENNIANTLNSRISTIALNNRFKHWPPSFKMWSLSPIFGNGSDSFGWLYNIEFKNPKGKYYVEPPKNSDIENHKLYSENYIYDYESGTSHNLYLQTLLGKGFWGFISLLGFLLVLLFNLLKKLINSNQKSSLNESILLLTLTGSLLSILIYGMVQEIFYTQPVSLVFWIVIFSGAALTHNHTPNKKTVLKYQFYKTKLFQACLISLPIHWIYQWWMM